MGHTFVVRALFHVMFEAPWFWRNFLEKNRTQNKVTNCLAFFCILFIYCVYKVATARANPKGYQSFRPLCGVCSQMTKWFSILGVWMCLVLCRGTSVRSWNLLSDQLLPRSPRPEWSRSHSLQWHITWHDSFGFTSKSLASSSLQLVAVRPPGSWKLPYFFAIPCNSCWADKQERATSAPHRCLFHMKHRSCCKISSFPEASSSLSRPKTVIECDRIDIEILNHIKLAKHVILKYVQFRQRQMSHDLSWLVMASLCLMNFSRCTRRSLCSNRMFKVSASQDKFAEAIFANYANCYWPIDLFIRSQGALSRLPGHIKKAPKQGVNICQLWMVIQGFKNSWLQEGHS